MPNQRTDIGRFYSPYDKDICSHILVVVLKAPLQDLVVQYLMILAIPAALMALLATAILAMRLAVPRLRTAAAETILTPLGMVEILPQVTEGLEYCCAQHSGRVVPLPRSKALTPFLLSLSLDLT